MNQRHNQAFTLTELLTAIGIIAILATVAILILNPAELFKQSRDTQRISDLNQLDTLISRYQFSQISTKSLGSINTIYISIPDSDSGCANLGLSAPGGGYSYACVTEVNVYNIDGTGWLPVNISAVGTGGISRLPIDLRNTTSSDLFYKYVTDGSTYELNVMFESEEFGNGGSKDKVSVDGGDAPTVYETGSNLTIAP